LMSSFRLRIAPQNPKTPNFLFIIIFDEFNDAP